jgi:hypothetical protein
MRHILIILNRLLARIQNRRIQVKAGIRLLQLGDEAGFDVLLRNISSYTWDYQPTDDILLALDRYGNETVALHLLQHSFLFEKYLETLVAMARNHDVSDKKIVATLVNHLEERLSPSTLASIGRTLTSMYNNNPEAFEKYEPISLFLSCLAPVHQSELINLLVRLGAKTKTIERFQELFEKAQLWGGAQDRAKIIDSIKIIDEQSALRLATRDRLERARLYIASLESDLQAVDTITVIDEESYDHPIFGPSMQTIPNPNRDVDRNRIEQKIRDTKAEIAYKFGERIPPCQYPQNGIEERHNHC